DCGGNQVPRRLQRLQGTSGQSRHKGGNNSMNRLKMIRETRRREGRHEDDVQGHGLHFPVRSMTERIVRLCEDLEAQHIPSHGSWFAIDMASLSSEWLRAEMVPAAAVDARPVEEALSITPSC